MRSFRLADISPSKFCTSVDEEIEARNFGDIVSLRLLGDELSVLFSWMGRSSLKYRINELPGGGFEAILLRERMSPMHMGFRRGFEERFETILEAVGAELL